MNIYIMKNFTLQELYFGVTDENAADAVKSHKRNPNSPVEHWKFGVEEIKWGVVQTDLPPGVADSFVQALRREPQEDGWVVVYGGDDLKRQEEEEE